MKKPILYMDEDIRACLQDANMNYRPRRYFEDNPPRSPYQILGDTRGLKKEEIIKIYFPDEVADTEVEKIAKRKLNERGISDSLIAYESELQQQGVTSLNSCLTSYGDFLWNDLKDAIRSRKFIHILDDEIIQLWEQNKL